MKLLFFSFPYIIFRFWHGSIPFNCMYLMFFSAPWFCILFVYFVAIPLIIYFTPLNSESALRKEKHCFDHFLYVSNQFHFNICLNVLCSNCLWIVATAVQNNLIHQCFIFRLYFSIFCINISLICNTNSNFTIWERQHAANAVRF